MSSAQDAFSKHLAIQISRASSAAAVREHTEDFARVRRHPLNCSRYRRLARHCRGFELIGQLLMLWLVES